jgi:hypothetical protein
MVKTVFLHVFYERLCGFVPRRGNLLSRFKRQAARLQVSTITGGNDRNGGEAKARDGALPGAASERRR